MAVTLRKIADDIGMSVVTVSKVLRNSEDVSKKTRELVLQRAKELGYRPNLNARSLVTGRSSLVGLLVPDLIHPFFSELAHALASTLRKQGLYVLICSSEGDPELERTQIEHLLSRRLDAIVVASVGSDETVLQEVVASSTPLVLIDRKVDIAMSHFVGTNDLNVGSLATQHLAEIGCKRIAHIRGPRNSPGERRFEGYRRSLNKAGLVFDPELVSPYSSGDVKSKEQGAIFAEQLLALDSPPDAFFCFSDPMAVGTLQAVLEAGFKVPDDIAIVGCGNLHYDDNLRVSLSSVDQNSYRIGEKAAQLILEDVIRGRFEDVPDAMSRKYADIHFKPRLVVRESSSRS